MLTRLRLSNFRRHEETEIHFPANSQLVLISGSNGSGKTSLLESIQYAFYGESRHGKRNLDSLVRRGAELEGMEVELDFTIDDAEYSIKRRRVNKLATAVLYGNGNPLVEGTGQVTAEITKILGMDSSAFRLAVIAQQKELDGLASLRPAERAAQLSRLLRLDAVTRARDEARTIFRHEREVVKGIGTLDDIDRLKEEENTAAAAVAAANVALNESSASLLQLDADLAASSAVDAAYSQALTAAARAEGMVANAETEVQRLSMDLSTLVVPVAVEPPSQTIEELALLATDVERAIAKGEAAQQAASQHQMLTSERDRAQKRLDEVTPRLKGTSSKTVRGEQKALEAERQETTRLLAEAQETFTLLREQAASKDAELKMLQARKDRTSELGPVCDACGQDVPETHRHTQEEELEGLLQAARVELEALFKAGREAKEAIAGLTRRSSELTEELKGKAELAQTLEQLESERSELTRRRDTYDAQLSRIDVVEVDLEELYAKKGEIAIDVARAQQANEAIRARENVLSKKLDLDMALSGAQERLQAARQALAAAEIDADLTAAYHERRRMAEVRSEEQTMLHHWSKELAVAKERHASLTSAVKRAEKALERRRAHETKAQAAANAGRVLQVVEEVLNTQIRPALEGGVSEVLGTLSEGRFSAVRVDQDYNISVNDDGSFRPLTDLSGGELDLVALAVRLALAGVVSDRSGGGAGFLILDEIFGSQDTARREAILAALRNLRATYGQILIISHVGGLEDSADVVIEVTAEEDEDGMRTATAKVA